MRISTAGLTALALFLTACAGPDYKSYDPLTTDLGAHGERQQQRLADLAYCRHAVAHFHRGPGLGDIANGATRGLESGASVILVYPPAAAIGGGMGVINALSGQSQGERDVRMLVHCLAGMGNQHGYVVMDARL